MRTNGTTRWILTPLLLAGILCGCGEEKTENVTILAMAPDQRGGIRIPDTGQVTSRTETFGEDPDYVRNPRSYTKLDAAGAPLPDDADTWTTVRDDVTGLIWEVKTDDGSIHDRDNLYAWLEAREDYVRELNRTAFGGFTDWRLPYIRELVGLVHGERYYPAIDTDYFPNTPSPQADFWSYDIVSSHVEQAWYIHFGFGSVYFNEQTDARHVRAVRGEAAFELDDYVDNGDGTVTDRDTGLMWQQATSEEALTWEEALAYCEGLTLAGYSDWRLPDRNELHSLLDKQADCETGPPIHGAFPDTISMPYWTSTNHAVVPDSAWCVSFIFGQVGCNYRKEHHNYVRAVRGGNAS